MSIFYTIGQGEQFTSLPKVLQQPECGQDLGVSYEITSFGDSEEEPLEAPESIMSLVVADGNTNFFIETIDESLIGAELEVTVAVNVNYD